MHIADTPYCHIALMPLRQLYATPDIYADYFSAPCMIAMPLPLRFIEMPPLAG